MTSSSPNILRLTLLETNQYLAYVSFADRSNWDQALNNGQVYWADSLIYALEIAASAAGITGDHRQLVLFAKDALTYNEENLYSEHLKGWL